MVTDRWFFLGEEILFIRKASGLVREIGPWTVMTIGLAYVIADGIYNLTEWQFYEEPGANYPLALILGFIALAFAAFSIIFLTAAMPRTASDYVAVSRITHPILGYIDAVLAWGCHVWIVAALAYFQGWYWGSVFIQAGYAIHNPGWISFGSWLSGDVMAGIGLAVFFIVIFTITNLLGIKIFKYTVNILVALAVIGGAITLGVSAWSMTLGSSGIKHLWDLTYGSGAYDEIVHTALNSGWANFITKATGSPKIWGWPGGWIWAPTFAALIPAAYAFWGMEFANYMAGEISKPKKSYLYGVVGAMIFILAYYLIMAVPTIASFGKFGSYYNYVMYGGNGVNSLKINPVQTPTVAVMLASLVGGIMPWVAIVITITVAIWVISGLPVYMMVPSKISFALAFDRFFPKRLADVNARFRTPHWSIIVTAIASILLTFFAAYSPWLYAISVVSMIIIRWLFSSWAAMLLPYWAPRAYEQGYTQKLFGIPLTTIVGAISTGFMTFFLIEGIAELAKDIMSLTWFAGWLIFSTILFTAYSAYNKSKGIEVEKIFREVPPA